MTLVGIPDLEEAIGQLRIEADKESVKQEAKVAFLNQKLNNNHLSGEAAKQHITSLIQSQNRKDVVLYLTPICKYVLDNMLIIRFKESRSDVMTCVESLVYFSKRIRGIPALSKVRTQFKKHYGKRFVAKAVNNSNGVVNESLVSRLSDSICHKQVEKILLELGQHNSISTSMNSLSSNPFSIRSESIDDNANTTKEHQLPSLPHENESSDCICNSTDQTCEGWENLPTAFGRTPSSFNIYGENDAEDEQSTTNSISLLAPTLPIYVFNPNSNLEIGFDARTRNPLYVLERITGIAHTTLSKARPQFFEQQSLPEVYRSKLNHYFRSGYDRGHMAPVADFPEEEVRDTFTLCNASPQLHRMNCSVWAKLEHWCRRVARKESEDFHGSTYVVTGPLWLPAIHESEKQFRYAFPAIGSSAVSLVHVPTHFFKVLVVISNAVIRKYACVVVPNSMADDEINAPLNQYIVLWTDLEAMSGLQFFPALTNTEGWKERADHLADDAMKGLKKACSVHGANVSPFKKKNKIMSADQGSSLEHLCLQ